MQIGLFGKLQSKRDFIAVSSPRRFLTVWENWMQSAIATSKLQLGQDWQQFYLTSPIWRFWLGAEIGGFPVTGAVMPSMDNVGRYFPLTLHACADAGEAIDPPEIEAHDDWFMDVEDFLLATLEPTLPYEAVQDLLSKIAAPRIQPNGASQSAAIVRTADISNFPESFGAIRTANAYRFFAGKSFWWTVGGVEYNPIAIVCHGMPEPALFSKMLTGQFEAQPNEPRQMGEAQ